MSKKMPSGTNFFKALIKEDLDELGTQQLEESLPDHNEVQTPEIDDTAKESQIEDVVKVMEQAASTKAKDVETRVEEFTDVTQRIEKKETQSNPNKEEQIKKKKKKISPEEVPSPNTTKHMPVNGIRSTASPLKQRGFYITAEQYINIKFRAAQEDCDGSQIVRNALDAFFGMDIE